MTPTLELLDALRLYIDSRIYEIIALNEGDEGFGSNQKEREAAWDAVTAAAGKGTEQQNDLSATTSDE